MMNLYSQNSSESRHARFERKSDIKSSVGERFSLTQNDSSVLTTWFQPSGGSSEPAGLWPQMGGDTSSAANLISPDRGRILGFHGESYQVRRAIPVSFRRAELGEFVATFTEANISFVGENMAEALNGLKAEILDTLEEYEEHEPHLGPEPVRQLAVLRRYIKTRK